MENQEIKQKPIVIDNGSGMIKAGFAGDDLPTCIFPSIVGKVKHQKVMVGGIQNNLYIGNSAEEFRGLLKLHYPIEHGIVTNWNEMEMIWNHVYSELNVKSQEHPVLLTEAPMNPKKNREKAIEIFFETYGVPSFYIAIQAVMALYSSGRTTGVVVDSGDGVTHIVPVYEGFSLPQSISRINLAGRNITKYLQLLLRKSGYSFITSAEFEIVRNIKEQSCELAQVFFKDQTEEFEKSIQPIQYQLPDKTEIQIGRERFQAPEILFRPEIIGLDYQGIHENLVNSIQKTDVDLRSRLYQNIILSGGTTMIPQFGNRLLMETKNIAPKDINIRIIAPPERKFSIWIGGSILASVSYFQKMWISMNEYDETGVSIIHKKCF
ncbi:actin-42a [Anaeramoeba ignava]|uniref:Actin-42a n=1 Tax=Anaeramoeba ignava TaxID=1746090 RepID=A0A9Q0R870_ANAIG|nr:actin-42a [Anaeramoeba ignava]